MNVDLEVIEILEIVENIAVGGRIRELERLQETYGQGRWRKVKGIGRVRLKDGTIRVLELHWYEAHGIGRFEIKPKMRQRPRP